MALEAGEQTLPVAGNPGGVAEGLAALRGRLQEQAGEEELGGRAIHGPQSSTGRPGRSERSGESRSPLVSGTRGGSPRNTAAALGRPSLRTITGRLGSA